MLGCSWCSVAQPLLQFKERHRLLRVKELRRNGRAGSMACNVAANILSWDAGLAAQRGDDVLIEVLGPEPLPPIAKQQINTFSRLSIQAFRLRGTLLFAGSDRLTDISVHWLRKRGCCLVHRNIEKT